MQYLPGKRVLALVVGLAAAAVGSAYAQDTTETGRATIDTTAPAAGAIDTSAVDTSARDTTDTSGVQNPPGYRGMERDTTMFPDSGSAAVDTGAVQHQATGTYTDSASQDTTGADTTSVGDTEPMQPDAATPRLDPSENAAGDTATPTPDSTQ
jgi:hypothetical protein